MTKRRKQTDLDSSVDTVAGECIAVRLRIVNRVVTGIYDKALRPLDLKVSQMNILVATAKLGVARPADICRLLHLEVSTLSRNVERMKTRGWLETVPDSDGRAQPFRLSTDGKNLLRKAIPLWEEAQAKAAEAVGQSFIDGLGQAVASVNRSE